ncbi:MAG: LacI family transcriptional regulator [Firmicutes bacterium]|nr:LacI family transcriptional regulator [Bacillota bacterium]
MPRPTSKDVARRAGVSRTTVSLVLNNVPNARVSEETRQRILKAARELDYRPNELARGLKTNRSKMLALLIPSITNPFYAHVAQGVEDVAHHYGYTVFLCNTYRDDERVEKYIRTLLQRQVDGVIMLGIVGRLELIERLVEEGIPVVVFDREVLHPQVDRILVNHFYGGWLAADHLLGLGHRRIVFISSPLRNAARRDRVDGFRAAFAERGLVFPEENLLTGPPEPNMGDEDYELQNGYRLTKEVLVRFPEVTAIACLNDMSAIGTLQALEEAGICVPEEISVIGYDDIPVAKIVRSGLTTIGHPQYERGKAAAQVLIQKLRGERENQAPPLFTPWLVVRRTTASPRS